MIEQSSQLIRSHRNDVLAAPILNPQGPIILSLVSEHGSAGIGRQFAHHHHEILSNPGVQLEEGATNLKEMLSSRAAKMNRMAKGIITFCADSTFFSA